MTRRKTSGGSSKKKQEEEWITELFPADVLFGRGSGPNDHEGNVRFRAMVAQRKNEYLATTHRQTKAKIAREIVDNVWSRGGRFLKRVDGGVDAWCIVDEETTMEKAKQALRQNREKTTAQTITTATPAKPKAAAVTPTASVTLAGAKAAAASGELHREPKPPPPPRHVRADQPVSAPPAVGGHAAPMASYSAAAATAHSVPPSNHAAALPLDAFEPIPVEQMASPSQERMPSGLEVWADFAATNPPGTSSSMSSSGDAIQFIPQNAAGAAAKQAAMDRERRESLQIADLVRSDPLQQGGFFDDSREKGADSEVMELVDGVLRLSTRTMDEEGEAMADSSTTMGTIERPLGTSQRASSITTTSTKTSHMSGISMEGSDSSLFADALRTASAASAVSDLFNNAAKRETSGDSLTAALAATSPTGNSTTSSRRSLGTSKMPSATEPSLTLSEVWRRDSLMGKQGASPGDVIQEGDESGASGELTTTATDKNASSGMNPRRLSQLQNDPDMLDYLGSSSMSVIKTAMTRSGDSAMSFSKGLLDEQHGET